MSARTCLLCGKPLSRIWVGAGDDFCSREHGNQYRLKRGMDRLTEANKISSLMRRRENPRPIASAQPAARFRLLAPRFPGSEDSSRRRNAFPVLAPAFRVFDAADLAGLRALRAAASAAAGRIFRAAAAGFLAPPFLRAQNRTRGACAKGRIAGANPAGSGRAAPRSHTRDRQRTPRLRRPPARRHSRACRVWRHRPLPDRTAGRSLLP